MASWWRHQCQLRLVVELTFYYSEVVKNCSTNLVVVIIIRMYKNIANCNIFVYDKLLQTEVAL